MNERMKGHFHYVPSPPKSGEKVADRPDEGACSVGSVREEKQPPHPSPLPQFVCEHATQLCGVEYANKLRERGQIIAVQFTSCQFNRFSM